MRNSRIVLDGADDGLLAARQAALAPAEDALVGLDLDDELVTDADPDGIRLDGGDLHLIYQLVMEPSSSRATGR
jgi:hypothetical protein